MRHPTNHHTGRTDSQCRERYVSTLDPTKKPRQNHFPPQKLGRVINLFNKGKLQSGPPPWTFWKILISPPKYWREIKKDIEV